MGTALNDSRQRAHPITRPVQPQGKSTLHSTRNRVRTVASSHDENKTVRFMLGVLLLCYWSHVAAQTSSPARFRPTSLAELRAFVSSQSWGNATSEATLQSLERGLTNWTVGVSACSDQWVTNQTAVRRFLFFAQRFNECLFALAVDSAASGLRYVLQGQPVDRIRQALASSGVELRPVLQAALFRQLQRDHALLGVVLGGCRDDFDSDCEDIVEVEQGRVAAELSAAQRAVLGAARSCFGRPSTTCVPDLLGGIRNASSVAEAALFAMDYARLAEKNLTLARLRYEWKMRDFHSCGHDFKCLKIAANGLAATASMLFQSLPLSDVMKERANAYATMRSCMLTCEPNKLRLQGLVNAEAAVRCLFSWLVKVLKGFRSACSPCADSLVDDSACLLQVRRLRRNCKCRSDHSRQLSRQRVRVWAVCYQSSQGRSHTGRDWPFHCVRPAFGRNHDLPSWPVVARGAKHARVAAAAGLWCCRVAGQSCSVGSDAAAR